MRWRRNGAKLARRKAIKREAARRMRTDPAMAQMYNEVRDKIRRFYDIVPMTEWWPLSRKWKDKQ